MTAVQKHFAVLLLLSACAVAQNAAGTAMVQRVSAVPAGSDLRVEITLNGAVNPSVETAIGPDRILIDLPDTACSANTQSVAVNANGVRRVRTGQHSTTPMITRVVVDLDMAHPYTLKTEGNRVILTVGPAENARRVLQHGAPVAATSGNLIGVFRRKSRPSISEESTADVAVPAPPATPVGPGFEPSTAKAESTLPAPPPAVAQSQGPKVTAPVTTPPATATQAATAPGTAAPTTAPQPSFQQNQIAVAPKQAQPTPPPVVASASPSEGTVETVAAEPIVTEATLPKEEPAKPTASTGATHTASAPSTTVTSAVKNPEPVPPVPATAEPKPAPVEVAANAKTDAAVSDAASDTSGKSEDANTNAAGESAEAAIPLPDANADGATMIARSDDPSLHTVFKVKYVAEGVAYLDGGRAQGLTEGMKLEVKDSNLPARQGASANAADPKVVAELEVTAVADTSAVTDIHIPKRAVKVGDLAYLSNGDTESLVQQRALSATRQYPAVISFTEGDTLDEEVRAEVPRPPLPSVNRARGRIGFDSIETISRGTSSVTSSDLGVVFRGDITRIGGTYWNLSGYWRGRLTKESAAAQATLQETINRTYHLNMTYDNPNSVLVAGFGRLYLPWAPSLDTIDGGYFGAHLSKGTTLGIFGGSTPDPSSWDYSPNRAIGGSFINFEGGDYNGFHYSATSGVGISMVKWAIDRPFAFFEDQLSYKRDIAIYESAQFDRPHGTPATVSPGPGLGRNFFTLRVNPHPRLELDANYNYFRDIPTYDPTLLGTSLLDKYLFQGFSAGGRLQVLNQVWLSTNLGRSSRSGDNSSSLNQMYGITFGRLPFLNVRADVHYTRFNSSFGQGNYEAVDLSRQMGDRVRLEVLVGEQKFASPLTANTRSRFLTGTIETTLGPHYYLQSNFTTNRGDLSYDQFMFSVGYRFDSKRRGQ